MLTSSAAVVVVALLTGCGSSAVGIEESRRIADARVEQFLAPLPDGVEISRNSEDRVCDPGGSLFGSYTGEEHVVRLEIDRMPDGLTLTDVLRSLGVYRGDQADWVRDTSFEDGSYVSASFDLDIPDVRLTVGGPC